jgi:hypothetical protein
MLNSDNNQPEISNEVLARWAAHTKHGVSNGSTNCFSFGWGGISEGIEVVVDHPLTPNKTAVFVGNHYFFQNNRNGFDCIQRNGKKYVLQASIETIKPFQKAEFKVLSKQQGDKPDILILIDTGLPDGMTPKGRFSYGAYAIGGGKVEAKSGKETLVSIPDLSHVDVYFMDGSVRRIERKGSYLNIIKLSVTEQGLLRVRLAQSSLDEIESLNLISDERAKRRDAVLHQVATVTEFGGKDPEIMEATVSILLEAAEAGIGTGVKNHMLSVLATISPAHALILNKICDDVSSEKRFGIVVITKSTMSLESSRPESGITRLERERRKKASRDLRHAAQTPKGSSGVSTTKQSKKGANKKK